MTNPYSRRMVRRTYSYRFFLLLGLIAVLLLLAVRAQADITVTGTFSPDEPFWSNEGDPNTEGIIGSNLSSGNLTVTNGSLLELRDLSTTTRTGSNITSTVSISSGGQVRLTQDFRTQGRSNTYTFSGSIAGNGSKLDVGNIFWIGDRGSAGDFTIGTQAEVNVSNRTILGYSGARIPGRLESTLTLDGGTLNTATLFANQENLLGHGTINTSGLIRDGWDNYLFDFNGSNVSQINLTGDGKDIDLTITGDGRGILGVQNVVIRNGAKVENSVGRVGYEENPDLSPPEIPSSYLITGAGTEWTINSASEGGLSIGERSDGILRIENGATVNSVVGNLGFQEGEGQVKVTGAGSTWNSESILIGRYGTSEMTVSDQAQVNTESGDINRGQLTIKGAGSAWTSAANVDDSSSGYFEIGNEGSLNVASGGQMNADNSIFIAGEANLYVSGDNMLNAGTDGTGNFENNDTVRLFAGQGLAAGTYTPITVGADEGAFFGTGTYEAFGGVWNDAAHTFTVGALLDGSGGIVGTDLTGQRYEFSFGGNPEALLTASFGDGAGVADFSVLQLDLASIAGQNTLAVFDFTTTLADGNDVLLSSFVGADFDEEALEFWHSEDGLNWTLYTPETWVYTDDGWVSFLVDGFSGYAVTIPEPTTGSLLLGAGAAWLFRRRKNTLRTEVRLSSGSRR